MVLGGRARRWETRAESEEAFVVGFGGYDNPVGADQGGVFEEPTGGRGVDHGELVAVGDLVEGVDDLADRITGIAVRLGAQRRQRSWSVRAPPATRSRPGRTSRMGSTGVPTLGGEAEAEAGVGVFDTEIDGQVALRVEVDGQDLVTLVGPDDGQVAGAGGLAAAALAVDDRQDAGCAWVLLSGPVSKASENGPLLHTKRTFLIRKRDTGVRDSSRSSFATGRWRGGHVAYGRRRGGAGAVRFAARGGDPEAASPAVAVRHRNHAVAVETTSRRARAPTCRRCADLPAFFGSPYGRRCGPRVQRSMPSPGGSRAVPVVAYAACAGGPSGRVWLDAGGQMVAVVLEGLTLGARWGACRGVRTTSARRLMTTSGRSGCAMLRRSTLWAAQSGRSRLATRASTSAGLGGTVMPWA